MPPGPVRNHLPVVFVSLHLLQLLDGVRGARRGWKDRYVRALTHACRLVNGGESRGRSVFE